MAETSDSKTNKRPKAGARQGGDNLSSYVFGKVPPQSIPLEEAILGAILLEKDALTQVLDILQFDAFYVDAHQQIYQAMLRLFERSQPIDLLTIMEELKKSGELDAVGGPAYLAELSNKVASSANIEFHARIVAQKFIQRELIRISTTTINDAFEDTTDVFDLLDSAENNLFKIAERNMGRSVDRMGTLASKLLKQIEDLKDSEEGLTGVPTGFTELDRLTSGLQKSDLIILAARPGMGKCLGKGTPVLMFSGEIKPVEDVQVGDLLMGDDSTPRRVISLARGRERMYWIRQNKGMDYRVNESHILSLKKSRQEGAHERGAVLDISVQDYLSKSQKFKSNYKGYKVAVDFPAQTLPISPYFLGLWLGDGSSSKSTIINQDEEVVTYLEEYASELNHRLHVYKGEGKCPEYRISADNRQSGVSLQAILREIGVLGNKHIPENYLINSKENRLQLLAGLIDSDGHYLVQSNGYEITQKNERLLTQIKFLCDSLGYRVTLKAKRASIASIGYESTVYRLRIYGNIDEVPVRVRRKQANPWQSLVDWQVTGIHVEYDKEDDYYGFEIDGNRRFLLGDMTVTHNTALTLSLAKNAALDFKKGVAVFSLEMSSLQLAQRIISMEAEIPGGKLRSGKLEEYEWQQLHSAIERVADAPIFIDDTPGINTFELRAKCRRLKMQYDIQLIIIDYLQLMSGGGDGSKGTNREQEVSAISRSLKGLAKELNVPVIALSQLSRAVETRGGDKRPQLSDLRESGCLTGDTLLQDAITGARIPIKELAERAEQTPISVLAMDDAYRVVPHTLTKAFYSGQKEVFELTTRSGKKIKASANHPFRKLEGWVRLDALQVGDKIATPRVIRQVRPSKNMRDEELILLAHLIGDGCILPRQPYHYTSQDQANLEVVKDASRSLFGIEPRLVPQDNWYHLYLPSPYHLTHGKKHPITHWYDILGLERVRSYAKKLPKALFTCDTRQIALFLHHLWATDGNVSWVNSDGRKPSGAIYYATSSEALALQVQHLLCRFEIRSLVKKVVQGKYRPMYQVWISGQDMMVRFLKEIGCHGQRGSCVAEMIAKIEQIEANTNVDTIPESVWDLFIKPEMNKQNLTQRQLCSMLGIAHAGNVFQGSLSRDRLKRINVQLGNAQIENLSNSDLFWDEIVGIEALGVQDVYDATVPGVHNFVANDIIVHNSIEQDADMVLFIYRPEYYQILEDEEGQSLKGVADVIVAKNRHGALTDVRLRFTGEFARFSNMDDPDFGALPSDAFGSPFGNIITKPSKMNDGEDIPF